jgi:hypothetical protein
MSLSPISSARSTSSQAEMQKPGPTAVPSQPSSCLPKVTPSPAPQKATSGGDVDHDGYSHNTMTRHGATRWPAPKSPQCDWRVSRTHGGDASTSGLWVEGLNTSVTVYSRVQDCNLGWRSSTTEP